VSNPSIHKNAGKKSQIKMNSNKMGENKFFKVGINSFSMQKIMMIENRKFVQETLDERDKLGNPIHNNNSSSSNIKNVRLSVRREIIRTRRAPAAISAYNQESKFHFYNTNII